MWQRHPWPETIEEAIAIQEHLRPLVITENQLETVRYVAGVDVGYNSSDSVSLAAVTVLSFPDLQLPDVTESLVPLGRGWIGTPNRDSATKVRLLYHFRSPKADEGFGTHQ